MKSLLFAGKAFMPSKIVCIGRNYVEHIEELGNELPEDMVIFNKPPSAISDELIAHRGEAVHFEAELCFLIQNNEVTGVGFGLDLTKRELQTKLKNKGLPWEKAKAFDGAAVFSEFVPIKGDIKNLSFSLEINGQIQQQGDPALMIYPPEIMLPNLAEFMTLQDNDILMTGTPKGVGQLEAGASYTGQVYFADEMIIEHTWRGI